MKDRLRRAAFGRALPPEAGVLRLPGLAAEVEVTRDRLGVPHLSATSPLDLYRAQGYVHAQDRLWQMEFNRRLAAGRTAEILGARSVPLDRWMRTLSVRHVAEQEPDLLEEDTRRLLQAYADGVNARIDQGRLPLELVALRVRPEPWTPVDSLAWVKMMAWTLGKNWEAEILRARLVEAIGIEAAQALEPPGADRALQLAPELAGTAGLALGADALARQGAAEEVSGPLSGEGIGSNAWVIGGQHTASGRPLLANDMHLTLTIPAPWVQQHLSAGDLDVVGVSLPGVPGIVAGRNRRVAWGFTNACVDVQDLYVEHLRGVHGPDGQPAWESEFAGAWEPVQARTELIEVRGAPTVRELVLTTRHGPVINGLSPRMAGQEALALQWVAHEPNATISAIATVNAAGSAAELREAMGAWRCPALNVVYADVDGSIGSAMIGAVPVRTAGDGRLPVPGWTGTYEWAGTVPSMPHQEDPDAGWLASANERVPSTAWLGNDFLSDARHRRIAELLEQAIAQGRPITLEDVRAMQLDQRSIPAAVAAGAFARAARPNDLVAEPVLAELFERFADWDGTLAADSVPAAVYQVAIVELGRALLAPDLGELTEHVLGRGITPVLAESSVFGEHVRVWLEGRLAADAVDEEHLRAAVRTAAQLLGERLGPNPARWTWGRLHTLSLRHVLAAAPGLDRALNRGPIPMGGDGTTVWNSSVSWHDPFGPGEAAMVGPPFRFVTDLGDPDASAGILLPGQSGHPASPHYADNLQAWLAGTLHPMPMSRAAVGSFASSHLRLVPGGWRT